MLQMQFFQLNVDIDYNRSTIYAILDLITTCYDNTKTIISVFGIVSYRYQKSIWFCFTPKINKKVRILWYP